MAMTSKTEFVDSLDISLEIDADTLKKVYDSGNEHVFDFWDELNDKEKNILIKDLSKVDFSLLNSLYNKTNEAENSQYSSSSSVELNKDDEKLFLKAENLGVEFIKSEKFAILMVAGGQGTRLGFDGPKGCYPIGPVTGKSLFKFHAEKILAYTSKYKISIPWLIMTSIQNHDLTQSFFKENNYFGLNQSDIYIFKQNMIPTLNINGKLILENKFSLLKNPDGHGGSLMALNDSGVLVELEKRGIKIISYFQVDNPLVKAIDPYFIGVHLLNKSEVSSKAIKKNDYLEKVGVFVNYNDGTSGVVEYSNLPKSKLEELNDDNELVYSSANIAIHLFNYDFIKKIVSENFINLPFHKARKKVKAFTSNGEKIIDCLKFEKFIFDALRLTKSSMILQTLREDEFAPVKNLKGVDSVETSKKMISSYVRRFSEKGNVVIPENVENIEISSMSAINVNDIPVDLKLKNNKHGISYDTL